MRGLLSGGNRVIRLGGGGDQQHGKRGFQVTVIKRTEILLEQIQRLSWRTARKTNDQINKDHNRDYKEKHQVFRRQKKK